jgi:NADH-quinone oxidoreductase subunit L
VDLILQAILLLPLIGAILAGVIGKRLGEHAAEYIATGLLMASAALSIFVFLNFFVFGHAHLEGPVRLFQFLDSGTLQVDWSIRIDTLTAVMLVVVNGVSSLVHL